MSTSRNQIRRTSVDNSPPTDLLPGELAVEMGTPLRLWVGVPAALELTKRKKIFEYDYVGPHTHVIADIIGLGSQLKVMEGDIAGLDGRVTVMAVDIAGKAPLVHGHDAGEY
jgi:hypothetical protein